MCQRWGSHFPSFKTDPPDCSDPQATTLPSDFTAAKALMAAQISFTDHDNRRWPTQTGPQETRLLTVWAYTSFAVESLVVWKLMNLLIRGLPVHSMFWTSLEPGRWLNDVPGHR